MPIPINISQDKIIVNGQKAIDLGRTPKVIKPWKTEGLETLIDPITMLPNKILDINLPEESSSEENVDKLKEEK